MVCGDSLNYNCGGIDRSNWGWLMVFVQEVLHNICTYYRRSTTELDDHEPRIVDPGSFVRQGNSKMQTAVG